MTSEPVARVEEVLLPGELPIWAHPDWMDRFPWLVQGTTGAGSAEAPFDLGLFGEQPVGAVLDRWRRLRLATGMRASAHARQLHGIQLFRHRSPDLQGMLVLDGFDGHLTDEPGLLLAVSVADCVPIFLVDPEHRALAAVHAGWRGVAGGILEEAVRRMAEHFGSRTGEIFMHCGPAICGECYEVGPEVHLAVHPARPSPAARAPIDLRGALAGRGIAAGLSAIRVTISAHCSRCGPGAFFSHRAGSVGRQMGVLGRTE